MDQGQHTQLIEKEYLVTPSIDDTNTFLRHDCLFSDTSSCLLTLWLQYGVDRTWKRSLERVTALCLVRRDPISLDFCKKHKRSRHSGEDEMVMLVIRAILLLLDPPNKEHHRLVDFTLLCHFSSPFSALPFFLLLSLVL
jgi:hypothetical protein